MAYDIQLADRVRRYLAGVPDLVIEEKKMFSGLAFMIDDKMCINISGENLMCRYDPAMEDEVSEKTGFLSVKMAGRYMKGYCYVAPEGYARPADFDYWMKLCLDFNPRARSSKKR